MPAKDENITASLPRAVGSYVLERLLGEGGVARTYLARSRTGHKLAVKELQLVKARETKQIELFERECETLKGLEHPQIPKFIETLVVRNDETLSLFLVQEYIDGRSLQQLLDGGRDFSAPEVVAIMKSCLEPMKYLHAQAPPLFHRDIKPSNIILRRDGNCVLVDFGAVRHALADPSVRGSSVVGTFGYMAPEQFQAKAYPATDLYGLGATAFHLFAGVEPARLELHRLKPDIHPFVKDLDPRLATILDFLLEPAVEDRYATCASLSRALSRWERNYGAPLPMLSPFSSNYTEPPTAVPDVTVDVNAVDSPRGGTPMGSPVLAVDPHLERPDSRDDEAMSPNAEAMDSFMEALESSYIDAKEPDGATESSTEWRNQTGEQLRPAAVSEREEPREPASPKPIPSMPADAGRQKRETTNAASVPHIIDEDGEDEGYREDQTLDDPRQSLAATYDTQLSSRVSAELLSSKNISETLRSRRTESIAIEERNRSAEFDGEGVLQTPHSGRSEDDGLQTSAELSELLDASTSQEFRSVDPRRPSEDLKSTAHGWSGASPGTASPGAGVDLRQTVHAGQMDVAEIMAGIEDSSLVDAEPVVAGEDDDAESTAEVFPDPGDLQRASGAFAAPSDDMLSSADFPNTETLAAALEETESLVQRSSGDTGAEPTGEVRSRRSSDNHPTVEIDAIPGPDDIRHRQRLSGEEPAQPPTRSPGATTDAERDQLTPVFTDDAIDEMIESRAERKVAQTDERAPVSGFWSVDRPLERTSGDFGESTGEIRRPITQPMRRMPAPDAKISAAPDAEPPHPIESTNVREPAAPESEDDTRTSSPAEAQQSASAPATTTTQSAPSEPEPSDDEGTDADIPEVAPVSDEPLAARAEPEAEPEAVDDTTTDAPEDIDASAADADGAHPSDPDNGLGTTEKLTPVARQSTEPLGALTLNAPAGDGRERATSLNVMLANTLEIEATDEELDVGEAPDAADDAVEQAPTPRKTESMVPISEAEKELRALAGHSSIDLIGDAERAAPADDSAKTHPRSEEPASADHITDAAAADATPADRSSDTESASPKPIPVNIRRVGMSEGFVPGGHGAAELSPIVLAIAAMLAFVGYSAPADVRPEPFWIVGGLIGAYALAMMLIPRRNQNVEPTRPVVVAEPVIHEVIRRSAPMAGIEWIAVYEFTVEDDVYNGRYLLRSAESAKALAKGEVRARVRFEAGNPNVSTLRLSRADN